MIFKKLKSENWFFWFFFHVGVAPGRKSAYVWEKFERSKKDSMIIIRYYHHIKESLKSFEIDLIYLFEQILFSQKIINF